MKQGKWSWSSKVARSDERTAEGAAEVSYFT
jgi:hypothetical protein